MIGRASTRKPGSKNSTRSPLPERESTARVFGFWPESRAESNRLFHSAATLRALRAIWGVQTPLRGGVQSVLVSPAARLWQTKLQERKKAQKSQAERISKQMLVLSQQYDLGQFRLLEITAMALDRDNFARLSARRASCHSPRPPKHLPQAHAFSRFLGCFPAHIPGPQVLQLRSGLCTNVTWLWL